MHVTAPTDVPPEPPRVLVTPTAGGQGPTPHHPPLEMAHQLQQTPANIDVPPHDRSKKTLLHTFQDYKDYLQDVQVINSEAFLGTKAYNAKQNKL